mmetsp:Transcript_29452/g.90287  ORF Transcript_29452/g.90287 Transcript_29452/m.90287 type:complete len:96 (+) Transcript_29452:443-730(+)|eukprot:scaffold108306_cov35-Tisochrysis_lutea.AAC.1
MLPYTCAHAGMAWLGAAPCPPPSWVGAQQCAPHGGRLPWILPLTVMFEPEQQVGSTVYLSLCSLSPDNVFGALLLRLSWCYSPQWGRPSDIPSLV